MGIESRISTLEKVEALLADDSRRVNECDSAEILHKALGCLVKYIYELESRVKELEDRPVYL